MSLTVDYVEHVFAVDNDVTQKSQKLLRLRRLIDDFCDATLKSIVDNFGNFGLNTWAPLLSKICVEVGVSKFKEIHFEFDNSKECTQLIEILEFYENAFLVFIEVRGTIQIIWNTFLVYFRGAPSPISHLATLVLKALNLDTSVVKVLKKCHIIFEWPLNGKINLRLISTS